MHLRIHPQEISNELAKTENNLHVQALGYNAGIASAAILRNILRIVARAEGSTSLLDQAPARTVP